MCLCCAGPAQSNHTSSPVRSSPVLCSVGNFPFLYHYQTSCNLNLVRLWPACSELAQALVRQLPAPAGGGGDEGGRCFGQWYVGMWKCIAKPARARTTIWPLSSLLPAPAILGVREEKAVRAGQGRAGHRDGRLEGTCFSGFWISGPKINKKLARVQGCGTTPW